MTGVIRVPVWIYKYKNGGGGCVCGGGSETTTSREREEAHKGLEERDEEPVAAVPAKCDPRFLGICIPPRPGTKRDAPPEDSFHLPESDSKRKDLIRLLEGELLRTRHITCPRRCHALA